MDSVLVGDGMLTFITRHRQHLIWHHPHSLQVMFSLSFSFTGETAQEVLVAKCGCNLFSSSLRKDQFGQENLRRIEPDFPF